MKKKFKQMLYFLIAALFTFILVCLIFINFYPSFGGNISKSRQELYKKSPQFQGTVFQNESQDIPKEMGFLKTLQLSYHFFVTKVKNARPKGDLKIQRRDSAEVSNYRDEGRLIWYGHSSFLLQMEGKNILIDPMFSQVAAPHPWLGEKRFNKELPLDIKDLPNIDAMVFSHDHYDHLDYETIKQLKEKTEHYFVPLGVGVHLEAWGVPPNQITELDWWEEKSYKGIKFVSTPAQHFSGRGLGDRMNTLWSSWVIQSSKENIYFSGDTGYGDHFKAIGEKYGPFDLALMECGQYNEMWPDIHMMPEQTAQAGLDIRAEKLMPIHWGGFKLALHSWTDPIERVLARAEELDLPIVAPEIGETLLIKENKKLAKPWWKAKSSLD